MKILILGDLHLHSFNSYNLFGDHQFRLNQFFKLSDRLNDIISDYTCSSIIQCGDFLHASSPAPFIVNAAAKFLTKLNHIPIYLIHGNHDHCNKTKMFSDNTLLTVLDHIDNVSYKHHELEQLGNTLFYFKGWESEFNIDYNLIDNFITLQSNVPKYKVLITHATLHGVEINQYGYKLEGKDDLDTSKFDLCFAGDIHYPHHKGNIVIPGIVIPSNANDYSDTSVIIYDTETNEWDRVKVETDKYRFLKFVISDEESTDPYIINKPKLKKAKIETKELVKSIDINEVISKIIDSQGLRDIHDVVINKIKSTSTEDISYKFSISKLTLNNVKLIDYLELEPQPGVTLVVGSNGVCKSTVTDSLINSIVGFSDPRNSVSLGKSELSSEIELRYCGNDYKIIREWTNKNKLQLFINGVPIENSKDELEKRIRSELQFLNLLDLMYYGQGRDGLLSSYNYSERLELLSKVLKLSIIEDIHKASIENLVPILKDCKSTEDKIVNLKAFIKMVEDSSIDFNMLKESYSKRLEESIQLEALLDLIIESDTKVSALTNILIGVTDSISKINLPKIDDGESLKLNSDIEYLNDLISNGSIKLTKVNSEIIKLESEVTHLESIKKRLSQEELDHKEILTKLKTQKICNECNQPISDEKSDEMVNLKLKVINRVIEDLQLVNCNVNEKLKTLNSYKDDQSKLTKYLESVVNCLKPLKSKLLEIENDVKIVNSYKELITKQEDLKSQINEEHGKRKTLTSSLSLTEGFNPSSFRDEVKGEISVLKSNIERQKELQSILDKLTNSKKELKTFTKDLEDLISLKSRYEIYSEMFSNKGIITRSIMEEVSQVLSTDLVKVKSYKTLVNGETRPDLTAELKVLGNWISYNHLSYGQRTIVDMTLLSKLVDMVGGVGLLILDETLKFVDTYSLETIINIIQDLRVSNTFIVSHERDFPYYDQMLLGQFTETGSTFSYV